MARHLRDRFHLRVAALFAASVVATSACGELLLPDQTIGLPADDAQAFVGDASADSTGRDGPADAVAFDDRELVDVLPGAESAREDALFREDALIGEDAPLGDTGLLRDGTGDEATIAREAAALEASPDSPIACVVGGASYDAGEVNPDNVCQVCDPLRAPSWSPVADGTSCGSSGTCCGGDCVDESTDLGHCGSCSTACTEAQGPACTGGLCSYTLAMDGTGGPWAIAVDALNVYWTDDVGGVFDVPIAGGAVTTLATGELNVEAIALDESNVYWTTFDSDGTVMQVPKSGGIAMTLATGQSEGAGIAVEGMSLYWATYGEGNLVTVPIGGGAPVTLATAQDEPALVAADAANVYWTDFQGGTVMALPLDGGVPVTLASGQDGPIGIAVDAANVYWTANVGGVVAKVPIGGGTPTTLASGQGSPEGIAVDANNVYWVTTISAGAVVKVPIRGGTPTTIASGGSFLWGIAVDATSVYWTDNHGGGVMRAPK